MGHPMIGYPVVMEIPVVWGDMDSFQHVNNVVYLRWFESVRLEYLQRLGTLDGKVKTGIGPIPVSKYRIPLQYSDTVLVGVKTTNIGEDRFTMHHAVCSNGRNKIAAEGDGVIVMFDYLENRKVAVSDDLRKRISDLEGAARS